MSSARFKQDLTSGVIAGVVAGILVFVFVALPVTWRSQLELAQEEVEITGHQLSAQDERTLAIVRHTIESMECILDIRGWGDAPIVCYFPSEK